MEALGITRKAAKEGVKFIFEVVWTYGGKFASLLVPLRIKLVLEVTAVPHLETYCFLYVLQNCFVKYAGSIAYAVLIELKQNENK